MKIVLRPNQDGCGCENRLRNLVIGYYVMQYLYYGQQHQRSVLIKMPVAENVAQDIWLQVIT